MTGTESMRTLVKLSILLLALPSGGVGALSEQESEFVEEMTRKHGFSSKMLSTQLDKARYKTSIIKAISRPAEGMEWHRYREIFLQQDRIHEGVAFMNEHEKILADAEERYGVDPYIITAIIGVETKYGKITGNYRVIDALKTLAFSYPKRAPFFRGQLEEFFLMAREESMDPMLPKGSYAGAMGMPQFIPSSFRSFAVDFDNDGKRDLWNSPADIIGSVANYFVTHGWQRDAPVAFHLDDKPGSLPVAAPKGEEPKIPVSAIRRTGVNIPSSLSDDANTAIIELRQENGNEYWLGMKNFYVITRYNHSNLYAMAVFQLSEAIRKKAARVEDGDVTTRNTAKNK